LEAAGEISATVTSKRHPPNAPETSQTSASKVRKVRKIRKIRKVCKAYKMNYMPQLNCKDQNRFKKSNASKEELEEKLRKKKSRN
jgi:hypothetical protein